LIDCVNGHEAFDLQAAQENADNNRVPDPCLSGKTKHDCNVLVMDKANVWGDRKESTRKARQYALWKRRDGVSTLQDRPQRAPAGGIEKKWQDVARLKMNEQEVNGMKRIGLPCHVEDLPISNSTPPRDPSSSPWAC